MKFAYVDESGDKGQSDMFVMVGCVVDAYSLRRITADFDAMLKDLRERHPSQPPDLKTKAFINGDGGWRVVPPDERKALLRSICQLASHDSKLFASALSFERFKSASRNHPAGRTYWHAASLFVTSLIQKKMQKVSNNKGLTVLVMDDNKAGMPALSDAIYAADPWFDGLYQIRGRKRGVGAWIHRTAHDRFNQIINTAFAIKSDHSSLVQVADALAYVYRRNLELQSVAEAYAGEKALYDEMVGIGCWHEGPGPVWATARNLPCLRWFTRTQRRKCIASGPNGPQVQTDASVTIRPLILTPAQRVSHARCSGGAAVDVPSGS